MPATRSALLLVGTAIAVALAPPAAPTAAQADFINDCIGNPNPRFAIGDPLGLDYYDQWEKPILGVQLGQEAPSTSVGASITITCRINGHSIQGSPGFQCPANAVCVKFWMWERAPAAPRGVNVGQSCGTAFVDGATLNPRTTWNADARILFCEWYCPSFIAQCALGRTVEARTSASLTYRWEANELPALPGNTVTSGFEFESRPTRDAGSTIRTVNHVTCQAGLPVLADTFC